MKFNKWTLSGVAALVLAAMTFVLPQSASAQNQIVTVTTNASGGLTIVTNPATIQGGFQEVIDAVKTVGSNGVTEAHALWAPKLQKHWGGGIGYFWQVNNYLLTGVRMDWVDGGFWMPSGNATLQVPLKITSWLTVTPFGYAGVGVPVSGAKIDDITVPGKVTDNNGNATAITGYGAAIRVYSTTNSVKGEWDLNLVGDQEKWSGFAGNQYRAGVAYHSNKPGLFGIGIKIGSFEL